MKYLEKRTKAFNRGIILRQRCKKTRWGIERGEVFTMYHLWRWSVGIEHKSNRRTYWGKA
jgi:hypothetical protein